jgi:hypothetical protein
MSTVEDTMNTIYARLQELSSEATPEQAAYLARAFEAIAGNGKMIDIINLTDQKLIELLAKTNEHLAILEENKNLDIYDLAELRANAIAAIASAAAQNSVSINEIVDGRKPELMGLVNQFQVVNDVPENSSILKEIENEGNRRKFIQDGALPFIFGILSRSNDYYGVGIFTTELGNWGTEAANADSMLQLLIGAHSYTTEYAAFYKEPSLCFLQGSNGNFIQKELYMKYQANTAVYTSPYAALGVFFIKNTTDEGIATSINIGGSAYAAVGASVVVGTPNADTETLNWQNVYSYSTSISSFTGLASFNVPAHTTVAIILYTSSHYIAGVYSYYAQFLQWYVHSFRSVTLVEGLEIDVKKTLKAWQCKGFSSTYEVWGTE